MSNILYSILFADDTTLFYSLKNLQELTTYVFLFLPLWSKLLYDYDFSIHVVCCDVPRTRIINGSILYNFYNKYLLTVIVIIVMSLKVIRFHYCYITQRPMSYLIGP